MTGRKGVRAPALNHHISTLPIGTSAYTNDRCRCGGCRAAWSAYCQEARAYRAANTDPSAIPHGTYGGYTNYSCRCAECKGANAARGREYRARRRVAPR